MCFQWMKDKIEKGVYLESPEEFENDFTTIFTNAKIFNMPNTKIYKEAEFIHERGMEILENNLGIIYSLSVDYYLFDHNFPNNNFKEILNNKNNKKITKKMPANNVFKNSHSWYCTVLRIYLSSLVL